MPASTTGSSSASELTKSPNPPGARLSRRSQVNTGIVNVPDERSTRTQQPVDQVDVLTNPHWPESTDPPVRLSANCEVRAVHVPVRRPPGMIEPFVAQRGPRRVLQPVHRNRAHDAER
jgi:hypothetical protein